LNAKYNNIDISEENNKIVVNEDNNSDSWTHDNGMILQDKIILLFKIYIYTKLKDLSIKKAY